MICSVAFYYRPFNLLSPSVTEDKSKAVRYFRLWSALHLKFEPQLKIIGLRPTIVAIPRYVTKCRSARGTWLLPNAKIGQNVVQGKEVLTKPWGLWAIWTGIYSHLHITPAQLSSSADSSMEPLPHANACFTCELSHTLALQNDVFSHLSLVPIPSLIPRFTPKPFVTFALSPFSRIDLSHLPRKFISFMLLLFLQAHSAPC